MAIGALGVAGGVGLTGWGYNNFKDGLQTVLNEADGPSGGTSGNQGQALGAARESYVADLTGGTVATDANGQGMLVTRPNVGTTDVDVIGPNGEYIAVGGGAKAINPSKFGKSLSILKWAADQAGVPAQYYFAEGTPQSTINQATRVLGADNVFTFSMGQ